MRSKRDGKRIDFCTKREEYGNQVQKPEGGRAKLARDAAVLPGDPKACDADQDPPKIAQNYLECTSAQKFFESKSPIDFRARLQDLKRKNGRECKKSQVLMTVPAQISEELNDNTNEDDLIKAKRKKEANKVF